MEAEEKQLKNNDQKNIFSPSYERKISFPFEDCEKEQEIEKINLIFGDFKLQEKEIINKGPSYDESQKFYNEKLESLSLYESYCDNKNDDNNFIDEENDSKK